MLICILGHFLSGIFKIFETFLDNLFYFNAANPLELSLKSFEILFATTFSVENLRKQLFKIEDNLRLAE